jgi:hypothetical protein
MFIQKLDLNVDIAKVLGDLKAIRTLTEWEPHNQISLVHRPTINDPEERWKDGTGSLFQKGQRLAREEDFNVVNQLVPTYTQQILQMLADHENIEIGRARFMNMPGHRGLGVHQDESVRYHLVIKTHIFAYIAQCRPGQEEAATCYHLPADGHFYKVNTKVPHFVFNGDMKQRIHLVVCPRDE